ncbi:MAG: hypothetical protein JXR57_02395 [Bacteroidales bacterium]|nr:hypothetical protein [Bacteroidales bacterium]
MSDKYKIMDNEAAYFVTLTIVGWVDVFTRLNQKMELVNSIKYCQQHKGLVVFAWCLMPRLPEPPKPSFVKALSKKMAIFNMS